MEKIFELYRRQSSLVKLVLFVPITILLLFSMADLKNVGKSVITFILFSIVFFLLKINYNLFDFAEFRKNMHTTDVTVAISLYIITLIFSICLLSKKFLNKNAVDDFKLFFEAISKNVRIPFSFFNRILFSIIIVLMCAAIVNFALANSSKIKNVLPFIK